MYRSVEKKIKGKGEAATFHFSLASSCPSLLTCASSSNSWRCRTPDRASLLREGVLVYAQVVCAFYGVVLLQLPSSKDWVIKCVSASFCWGGAQALSNKNVKNPSFFFPKWEERSGTLIFPQNSRLFPLLIFLWYIIGAFF